MTHANRGCLIAAHSSRRRLSKKEQQKRRRAEQVLQSSRTEFLLFITTYHNKSSEIHSNKRPRGISPLCLHWRGTPQACRERFQGKIGHSKCLAILGSGGATTRQSHCGSNAPCNEIRHEDIAATLLHKPASYGSADAVDLLVL